MRRAGPAAGLEGSRAGARSPPTRTRDDARPRAAVAGCGTPHEPQGGRSGNGTRPAGSERARR